MEITTNKAILVVSFGTSFADTRRDTIEAIEEAIQKNFPDRTFYRAWTSKIILSILKKRDNIHIDTVCQAMERMIQDGITDVIVQPTHVLNGLENDWMKADIHSYKDRFQSISIGTPLLSSESDNEKAVLAVAEEFKDLKENEALVLMGHGTSHYANAIYAALDYRFKDMGYPNVFLGTVESYPAMEQVLKKAWEYKPEKVYLTPFMIVAGDHAINDMAGKGEDSWMSQFQKAGYDVAPVMKGLGQYQKIQEMFVEHAKRAEKI